jgi:phosphoglycolate phosphatase-like HAD superfamily hydrolase
MKPDPELVRQALALLADAAEHVVFIGDSISDIVVSQRTHVRSIGYAKRPERGEELATAGADAIVTTMFDIADSID